ncbi:methyltransferase domain-containing protein [Wukongibacter baidiensis]|uniref:class I SAM-dependent methyltransferase n=1 Tax=Wukongibacter baidiensis TaxID=1723361 RepID=UPI003D7F55D0
MNKITKEFMEHFTNKFQHHGPTPKGVDWGDNEETVLLRYSKMLSVKDSYNEPITLLDVGCGYGGLYEYAKEKGITLKYTGIDVSLPMIQYAQDKYKDTEDITFICKDIFDFDTDKKFDYIVCNGILTQKLSASIIEMDTYAHSLIKKMYELCNIGIAFNLLTTKVHYMVSHSYYRNPVELFAYCLNEFTNKIKIDHSYLLYEYTMYLYK